MKEVLGWLLVMALIILVVYGTVLALGFWGVGLLAGVALAIILAHFTSDAEGAR